MTRIYGIIGYPLTNTLSPQIHNAGYRKLGMNAVYIPIRSQSVEEALEFADQTGIQGLSVTIPHKETILGDLQQISEQVGEIGACNTVIRRGYDWIGYNTDAVGLMKALKHFLGLKTLTRRRVAIIGAGGAARAAAYVVKQMRGKACIFNRTGTKAKLLASDYGFHWSTLGPESLLMFEQYSDIIIQTTSVGMGASLPATKDNDPLFFYNFTGLEAVYDVIYDPEKTPMLVRAEEAGCRICNGYTMLQYQAYQQFSLFTGVDYE
jgi:3-dehydroquinate dehydratase/shikimate dehydrogenase